MERGTPGIEFNQKQQKFLEEAKATKLLGAWHSKRYGNKSTANCTKSTWPPHGLVYVIRLGTGSNNKDPGFSYSPTSFSLVLVSACDTINERQQT